MKLELTHYDTVFSIEQQSNEQSSYEMAAMVYRLLFCAGWQAESIIDGYETVVEEQRDLWGEK